MRIKLLYVGVSSILPKLGLPLGAGAIKLWIDGTGYTAASNDLGNPGGILLETPEINVGEPDPRVAEAFANLHGTTVEFEINASTFVRDGGLARVKLTRPVQEQGRLTRHEIEFDAAECRGIAAMAGAVTFMAEMVQLETTLADASDVLSEDDLTAAVEAAQEPESQPA